jgi:plasmid maintenance system killer protein
VPPDVARRALRKLEAVHVATKVTDLRVPPGNRLHALKGDRAGQHAIAVIDQWRICFRFDDGDANSLPMGGKGFWRKNTPDLGHGWMKSKSNGWRNCFLRHRLNAVLTNIFGHNN